MTTDFLNEILKHKRRLIQHRIGFYNSLCAKLGSEACTRYRLFHKVITKPGEIQLIAEIKKASPSKGLLCRDFDVLKIANIYAQHKAAAISVLTEENYFLGKPDYVKKVADTVNVPVLMKDFMIIEGQLFEARLHGASAVLLIVAILDERSLKRLIDVAARLDLDCLVEVHHEDELKRALDAGAEIIGINHRDLRTFDLNMELSAQLIPKIPTDKTIVVESGISSHEEVKRFQELGAHAVLIGETLMTAQNIGAKIREVMGQ